MKTLTNVKLSSLSGLRFCRWSLSGVLFGETIENVELSSLSRLKRLRASQELQVKTLNNVELSSLSGLSRQSGLKIAQDGSEVAT